MKRLRPDITEEEILREFSKAGEVLEIKIFNKDIVDPATKQVVG
jgi:RNA recognition motif-containing protein